MTDAARARAALDRGLAATLAFKAARDRLLADARAAVETLDRELLAVYAEIVAALDTTGPGPGPEPHPDPPQPSPLPLLVGCYDHDNNTAGREDRFARWAGYDRAGILRLHLHRDSIRAMRDNMFWLGSPTRDRKVCVLFPLLTDDMTVDGLLRGDYDPALRTVGQRLVGNGNADAAVAIGHEHNTNFFRWGTARIGADQYIACQRHVVDVLRTVPGQDFQIVWNLFFGGNGPIAYPGADHVDAVTLDLYDLDDLERDCARRQTQFWDQGRNRDGRGLRWFLDLVNDVAKPYGIDEVGNERRTSAGGGDCPDFWDTVRRLVDAGDCRWVLVHNVENADMDHRLTDYDTFEDREELARSAARFRELFGATMT